MARHKKDVDKVNVKGNRKEDLNPIRGKQGIIDPEKGPENK